MNVDVPCDLLTHRQAHTWVSLYPRPAQNEPGVTDGNPWNEYEFRGVTDEGGRESRVMADGL